MKQRSRIVFGVAIAIVVLVVASLRVEGNSHFLADGQSRYFLTMRDVNGRPRQRSTRVGTDIRGIDARKVLWFTLESHEFYDGKRTSTVQ